MSEALETLAKPILLRPHHVVTLFSADIHKSKGAIRQTLLQKNYSDEMISNMLGIYRLVLQEGSPIMLVPSMDDICVCCNIWKEDERQREYCFMNENLVDFDAVRKTFGMEFGGIYMPIGLLFKMKTEYEKILMEMPPDLISAQAFYHARLVNYERLYENLKQHGGAK